MSEDANLPARHRAGYRDGDEPHELAGAAAERVDDPYEQIARFYDLATNGFDADIDMYEALARRVDAPVLDAGTGTGRVAIELAKRGLQVVGIDRSPAMLAIARRKATALEIPRTEFHQDQIAAPAISGQYALILCALDTFLHLSSGTEQLSALRAWSERLAPGGLIAIDLPGPLGDWGDWDPGARALVLDWTRPDGAGRVSRFSSYRSDLAAQTRIVTDIFEELALDGTISRQIVEYTLRFVFPAEMGLLLRLAGLAECGRYGDYELGSFDSGSERMIVIAEPARRPPGSQAAIV